VAEVFVRYSDLIREKALADGIQQGFRQGVLQGETQGKRLGEQTALRESLIAVLSTRFGDIPAPIEAKIAAAESGQLRVWLKRAAAALSADTVYDAIVRLPSH
jgi:hypothetical protein